MPRAVVSTFSMLCASDSHSISSKARKRATARSRKEVSKA
ncbi:MAG: hypothetical protein BWY77_01511 [bacterium ADurb.Bin431]|nr:MAG: hypothetical protein BWY77_01511 [bacterium ADurb.Bin431]